MIECKYMVYHPHRRQLHVISIDSDTMYIYGRRHDGVMDCSSIVSCIVDCSALFDDNYVLNMVHL